MKTAKFLYSLLVYLIMSGCSNHVGKHELLGDIDAAYMYQPLWISIQDMSGRDLVKGIGYDWWRSDSVPEEDAACGAVKPDLYTLEFVFPDQRMERPIDFSADGKVRTYPVLVLRKWNGYSYLVLEQLQSWKWIDYEAQKQLPTADWITIKLKCPYAFGDDAVHEIVSYWGKPKEDDDPRYQSCERVVLDGKEFTLHPILYEGYWAVKAITVTREDKK